MKYRRRPISTPLNWAITESATVRITPWITRMENKFCQTTSHVKVPRSVTICKKKFTMGLDESMSYLDLYVGPRRRVHDTRTVEASSLDRSSTLPLDNVPRFLCTTGVADTPPRPGPPALEFAGRCPLRASF